MITATSSPDRFGSLLRGLLKKNIPNMVYLALIGFIGIPLPYLLALADWTYPNTGSDDCLYLSLVRTAADGTKTYGLPMFLPLEEARRQPLLREYMAEQYGEKLSTPETVDAETLEAR